MVDDFKITIEGSRVEGEEPSLWDVIQLNFKLKGQIDLKKAERAVSLSMEKYCSVTKTLELAGATITYKVTVKRII